MRSYVGPKCGKRSYMASIILAPASTGKSLSGQNTTAEAVASAVVFSCMKKRRYSTIPYG